MKKTIGITFIIALLVLAGCLTPQSTLADGSRLAVGDIVDVNVNGEKDFSKSYQIDGEGCIVMPMIGAVKVETLNTSDAAAEITTALKKVLVNPQVGVTFLERARMQIFVVGQVTKPGLVEIGVGERVLQALAQAGYDDSADLTHVNIRRGDEVIDLDLTKYLDGKDLTANRALLSGDTVVVPRVDMIGTVTVLGQVEKTGSIPLKRNMTFREVMGLIGGTKTAADLNKITVKREKSTEPILIKYEAAMAGDPNADVMLQPGDTIYVPETEVSYFTVLGGVNKPGQYPFTDKLTISEAVGVAGGAMVGVGDIREVKIMHASGSEGSIGDTITIDLTQVIKGVCDEPLLKRGDVVYVKEHKQKVNLWNAIQSLSPLYWIFK
ncbi:MAG: SLBB domain-containing protein [Armatimonadota bacterium]